MNGKLHKVVPITLLAVLLVSMIASALYRFLPGSFRGDVVESGSQIEAIWLYSRLCFAQPIIILVLHAAIATWLFSKAKHQNNNPWIWALLGLPFGLIAVATYYLIEIHKIVSTPRKDQET